MRVFICEFVTAGGLARQDLRPSLLAEARLIRDALMADVEAVPGVGSLLLAHDARLPAPSETSVPVGLEDDPWEIWTRLAGEADVVWPVAPESDGLLARLIGAMKAKCEHVIASELDAVAACSSKLATARRLGAAALPHIPAFAASAAPAQLEGPVVTKPDDGAGCENTRRWASLAEAPRTEGLIVQPYLAGTPASLSVLVRQGEATLLTVNRQHLADDGGTLSLAGLTVGALPREERLARLAQDVVDRFPGLRGLIGIDVMLTEVGPVVVEVNPRVTTSYAGLHQSLALNPAAFLQEFIRDGRLPAMPHLPSPSPVEIALA